MGLEGKPGHPAQRRLLIALGIAIANEQADVQRIVKADRRELAGRSPHELEVLFLERPPEASVG